MLAILELLVCEAIINPLMIEPIEGARIDPSEPAAPRVAATLCFDLEMYVKENPDLQAFEDLHPTDHLFRWGLDENRLTNSRILDRRMLISTHSPETLARASDRELLEGLTKPLAALSPKSLSVPPRSVQRGQIDCFAAIGTVLYCNTERQMERLIRSIQLNSDAAAQAKILVLDNSPEPAWRNECASEGVELFSRPENIGFGRGHNELMESAFDGGADYYLGINPDGFLLDNCLRELISFSRSSDDHALIEANTVPVCHPKWYDPITGETAWVSGVAFFVPRRIHEAVGGFDPDFPMYGEDVDYSFRVRTSGYDLRVCSTANFYHDVVPRFTENDRERTIRTMIGNWYLCKKWMCCQRAEEFSRALLALGVSSSSLLEVRSEISPSAEITELLVQDRFAPSRFW